MNQEQIRHEALDPGLITKISPAVALAAMESGVATQPITDFTRYYGRPKQISETSYT